MYTEVLSKFNQPLLPILALLIFISCFSLYIFWTFKKENKQVYKKSSYMPLHDGVKLER